VSRALRVGVLASGRGTNLQALLDAASRSDYPAVVTVVVSDHEDSRALARARAAGVTALFINPKDYGDRKAYEAVLTKRLQEYDVGLVCLAGFMRILGSSFVRDWQGRLMNVHPSLLPAFPGLNAQRQALAQGVRITGATVHFVDEGVDTGPIVLQAAVPVYATDTEETLAARILVEEHRIYPEAVRLFAEGRIQVSGRQVTVR